VNEINLIDDEYQIHSSKKIYEFGGDPHNMVRMEGLEPTCREALDPKSSASANFATSALNEGQESIVQFFINQLLIV
jgi:hypothetical protein